MRDGVIVLFTRVPVPGKTKTRLMPFLTGNECCRLQEALLCDIFEVLKNVKEDCDIVVCYDTEGDFKKLKDLLPGACTFFPQDGHNLGLKMHNAISQMLSEGYRRCLLIGSDLPLLRAEAVDEAFCLVKDNDIVLCPTEDGGYYLVGMKEPCKEIFDLEYGTSTALERTLAEAARSNKSYAIGTATMDIDVPEDLFRLAERLTQEDHSVCPKTHSLLIELNIGQSSEQIESLRDEV